MKRALRSWPLVGLYYSKSHEEQPRVRCAVRRRLVKVGESLRTRTCNCMGDNSMSERIYRGDAQDEYWFQEGCHILEVANHPADPQVSIARARVEPGLVTQWHCLHETWERYLIVAGAGVAEIGASEPTPVSAGDVVSIPPGTRQRIRNTGTQDLVFYAICSPRFTPACYRSLE